MKIKSNLFPDNFSIELNSSGAVLRYSMRIPKSDIGNLLTIRDNNRDKMGIVKSAKGNYSVVIRKQVSHVTDESVISEYRKMKLEAMSKTRLLKIQSLEIELEALNHGEQLKLNL